MRQGLVTVGTMSYGRTAGKTDPNEPLTRSGDDSNNVYHVCPVERGYHRPGQCSHVGDPAVAAPTLFQVG
jgi:hypothetical protein